MAKKEARLNGKVSVTIEDHMTALVTFTKEPEGPEWDSEKLIQLLKEKKISYGLNVDEVKRQLKIAQEKNDVVLTFVAAKADPPESMKAESVDWKDFETPPEAEPNIPEKLESTEGPVLYHEVQIKTKKQKVVEKKPSLPFMPVKKETIEVLETETKKERVYVDPTVEKWLWAEAGACVGIFYSKQMGKPGKNLHGDVVPAPILPDPHFYLGNHLGKKGHDILAETTGILRVGKNWADIIPFKPHHWEVVLSPDKATCLMNVIPGDQSMPMPSYEQVIAKAEELGFPVDQLISKEEMEHIIREHIKEGTPVENLTLTGHDDAFFDVVISEDTMQAILNIRKGRGNGKPLVLKDLGKVIRESKVKIIDNDILRQDILSFYESSETEMVGYVLAEGKQPKKGPDQMVDWSVRFFDEKDFLETKKHILDNKDALSHLDSAETYPLEELSDLAMVDGDQRILTLGPLNKGEPGTDVFGNAVQGLAGKEVQIQLYEGLERRDTVVISTAEGIFERALVEGVYHLRVRPHKDSAIRFDITPDDLQAFISFQQGTGSGKKITMDRIHKALEDEKIVKGVIPEALESLRSLLDNEEDCDRLLIAKGEPPEEGGTYKIQFLVQVASGKGVTIKSDGTADYKNKDQITRVLKDTPLARVLPPLNEPKSGWDIRGKELKPPASKTGDIDIGPNIRVEQKDEGERILIADSDGEMVFEKNRIEVKGIYTIKGNVNMSTGNVKFPGSVLVTGDVESGFVVMSDADIKIGGGADAALLSAGGDILIKAGVKGNQKGVLRAKQNIMAGFIEQATVLAVGSIKVMKTCLRSNIKCNGKLTVSEKGSIIGGVTKVKMGADLGNLGSQRNIPTKLHFGQDYLVEDQILVEEKEIKKVQEQITKIDLSMKKPEVVANKTELQSLFNQKTKFIKLLEKRNLRLFMLKERFEQHFDSEIRIRGSVFPGVTLESHGRFFEVSMEKKNVVYTFDTGTGRIIEKLIENKENKK